jgi:hypothetical protein
VDVVKPGELLTRHVGIEISSLWVADEQSQLYSIQLAILKTLGRKPFTASPEFFVVRLVRRFGDSHSSRCCTGHEPVLLEPYNHESDRTRRTSA